MKPIWIFALIAGALLLGGGGVVVYTATRGLRDNNPGNIEDDGVTAWEGLDTPRSEGGYLRFVSALYGIRAISRILSNYVALDGVAPTVSDLITRWAPPAANDTVSYIADVDSQLGLSPGNDAIDLSSQLVPLIAAIIRHENGIQPYSSDTLSQAINLA